MLRWNQDRINLWHPHAYQFSNPRGNEASPIYPCEPNFHFPVLTKHLKLSWGSIWNVSWIHFSIFLENIDICYHLVFGNLPLFQDFDCDGGTTTVIGSILWNVIVLGPETWICLKLLAVSLMSSTFLGLSFLLSHIGAFLSRVKVMLQIETIETK